MVFSCSLGSTKGVCRGGDTRECAPTPDNKSASGLLKRNRHDRGGFYFGQREDGQERACDLDSIFCVVKEIGGDRSDECMSRED